jgi:phosphoglycolate phosphatase
MKAPAAIAFDLDGTLIDSLGDIAASCNHVLAWAGRAPLPRETIATFVGDGVRALVARAFGIQDHEAPNAELDAWSREFVAYYGAHPADHTTWMPGALEALDSLRELPMAIVTNKARSVTEEVLRVMGARPRFAFVYGGGDGPLKPRPDPVSAVARALSVEVASLWVVGDSEQDVRSARSAGAVAVAVRGGFHADERLLASRPDLVLSSLAELPAHVRAAGS